MGSLLPPDLARIYTAKYDTLDVKIDGNTVCVGFIDFWVHGQHLHRQSGRLDGTLTRQEVIDDGIAMARDFEQEVLADTAAARTRYPERFVEPYVAYIPPQD